MASSRRIRLTALLALALVACALWVQDFADHTDDGCQTETHCLACRTALARMGMPAAVPAPVAALAAAGTPPTLHDPAVLQTLPSDRSSRGPPLAARAGAHG
jgi:hypothetical protein